MGPSQNFFVSHKINFGFDVKQCKDQKSLKVIQPKLIDVCFLSAVKVQSGCHFKPVEEKCTLYLVYVPSKHAHEEELWYKEFANFISLDSESPHAYFSHLWIS